jgi:cobalt-zinc-cadmium efflux system membrane fusion protein
MSGQVNRSYSRTMLIRVMLFVFIGIVTTPIFTSAQDHHKKEASHKHEKSGDTCFICDASSRDKGRLWCKEHDRYEDRCWLCHSELEDKDRLWCKEHSLYEDECFLCHPELKKGNTEDETTEKCEAHGVNKKDCYICNPSLREKGRLWCKEHGRYEDRCWLCHDELRDKDRPFCEEHHLYEDECFFCNPGLKKKVIKKSEGPSASPVLFCNEHKVPEHQCGICQPQLAETLEPGESMKIRFVSKTSTLKAGIRTALPQKNSSSPTVEAFCRVGYNENKLAHITPLSSGVIRRVLFDVGGEVKVGDVLAEIHSAEVAKAKSNFLSAIVDFQVKEAACRREESLVKQNISAARDFQEAEAACKVALLSKSTAQQRLLNFEFTQEEIAEIETTQDSSSILMVRAPFNGTLVARQAVMGEFVESGKALFTLANLSSMWLELSVPVDKAAFVKNNLDVEATIDNLPGITVGGKLVWIDTSIDERSRMLKARAVVSNDQQKLKTGMFGHARIAIGQISETLRIPKDALQKFEKNPYLFVKVEDDLYDLRRVSLGSKSGSTIDVISGIEPNEQVVVSGTFTMMSEFLKSRLGAGCVDD